MIDQAVRFEPSASDWKLLYRVGGAAALAAGILFRRNLGVEVALFSPQQQPETVSEAFALLQTHRLLGLTYLNLFDVVNYALLAVMFLALFVLLRKANPSVVTLATALGLVGTTVFLASNTALSMLSLSDQYAATAGEAERAALQAAGQALLALNRFGSGAHPGAGGYLNLLFVAAASLLISLVMLRSRAFNRGTAIVGILASALDLAYCLAYAAAPGSAALLAVVFIPAAGLFWMVWHILIGWRLIRLERLERKVAASQPAGSKP